MDIDINGLRLADSGTDLHLIDNGGPLILPARDYLVLFEDLLSLPGQYLYDNFVLNDDMDEILLLDRVSAGNHTVDKVEYDASFPVPATSGVSMALKSPALDNNQGENWCQSSQANSGGFGTPGSQNDCIRADLAISLSGVQTWEAGAQYTYTVTVENLGTAVAENLRLTSTLPEGVVLQSTAGEGWGCVPDNNALNCSFFRLESGQTAPALVIEVMMPLERREIVYTVRIASDTYDPVTGNNAASLATQLYLLAGIGDFVWHDENQNGLQDAGEAGIGNVSVLLKDDQGTQIASTSTLADGSYHFGGLVGGSYQVAVDTASLPANHVVSPVDQGGDDSLDSDPNPATVTLTGDGIDVLDVDFGYYLPSGFAHTLTVSRSGSGQGNVVSSPAGIDCGATCSHDFFGGTNISLAATADNTDPDFQSEFNGWSGGGCTGTGDCVITDISAPVTVDAGFDCTYRKLAAGVRTENVTYVCDELLTAAGFEVAAGVQVGLQATGSVALGTGLRVRDGAGLRVQTGQ